MEKDINNQIKVVQFLMINHDTLFKEIDTTENCTQGNNLGKEEIERLESSITNEYLEQSQYSHKNNNEGVDEEIRDLETKSTENEENLESNLSSNEWSLLRESSSEFLLKSKFGFFFLEVEENYLAYNISTTSEIPTALFLWENKIGVFLPPFKWVFLNSESNNYLECVKRGEFFLFGSKISFENKSFVLFIRDSNNKRIYAITSDEGKVEKLNLATIGDIKKFSVTLLTSFSENKFSVSILSRSVHGWTERLLEICLKEKSYKFGSEIKIISKKIISSVEWTLRKKENNLYLNSQYLIELEEDCICCTMLSTNDTPIVLGLWQDKIGLFIPPLTWSFTKCDANEFKESAEKNSCYIFGDEKTISKGLFALFLRNSLNKKIYCFLSKSQTSVQKVCLETLGCVDKFSVKTISPFSEDSFTVSISYKREKMWKTRSFTIQISLNKFSLSNECVLSFLPFPSKEPLDIDIPFVEINKIKFDKLANKISNYETLCNANFDNKSVSAKRINFFNHHTTKETTEKLLKEEKIYLQQNPHFQEKVLNTIAYHHNYVETIIFRESTNLGNLCDYYMKCNQQEYQYNFSSIILGSTECIAFLHKICAVHGSINPYNFFVSQNEMKNINIKICDFDFRQSLDLEYPINS
eukprot:TRINITY_DN4338_c0_g1_i1.p1 TRINITY_DN4338_c0_g1~~TRINITY_DN4338_c0_g1_i1.p1  ORF type:complete len:640 (-),score=153.19 TRINITY_DN4338_c0_g1_i1:821-2740(-)